MIQMFRNKLHVAIPEIIENLPDLEVLQLWENNFIRSIPQGLEKNEKLGGLGFCLGGKGKMGKTQLKRSRAWTEGFKCHKLIRLGGSSTNFFTLGARSPYGGYFKEGKV